jgi:HD superfamily phosphodiesterase
MVDLSTVEQDLRARVRGDEARFTARERTTDALWDHLRRVAALAERLGHAEGLDPAVCRLAALFHDAGKFAGGRYHEGDVPEEERSVVVLRELAAAHGLPDEVVEETADAILELYRDDPEPSPLGRVLFDADNLDKLGLLGVANYFIKTGLRGRGLSRSVLERLTVELTYARHAEDALWTAAGRELGARRAKETIRYHLGLVEALREDGLAGLRVETVEHHGLTIDVVCQPQCDCGGTLVRKIVEKAGIKCSELRVIHECDDCGDRRELRFCRPRLAGDDRD